MGQKMTKNDHFLTTFSTLFDPFFDDFSLKPAVFWTDFDPEMTTFGPVFEHFLTHFRPFFGPSQTPAEDHVYRVPGWVPGHPLGVPKPPKRGNSGRLGWSKPRFRQAGGLAKSQNCWPGRVARPVLTSAGGCTRN